jgi:hypothetical protein
MSDIETYDTVPDVSIDDGDGTPLPSDPTLEVEINLVGGGERTTAYTIEHDIENFDWDTASVHHVDDFVEIESSMFANLTSGVEVSAVVEYDPGVGGIEGFTSTETEWEFQ